MSRAGLAALAVLLAAAPARGDSPRLAEARRAVEDVDYDAARRLLVEALHDGDNSPAAMREIYRLSARAAVVLDQPGLAEQYYRRWLAIDPDAALPGDTAPKLREPFVAAQAYVAAHGRLLAHARRTEAGELDVELLADPLAMAHAAAIVHPGPTAAAEHDGPVAAVVGRPAGPVAPAGPAAPAASAGPTAVVVDGGSTMPAGLAESLGPPVAFDGQPRVHLGRGARAAILDDRGNRLLELEPEPAAAALAAPAARTPEARPPWTGRWLTWAIPTAAFALVATGFGVAALASYDRANQITAAGGQYYLSDAETNVHRGRIFTWIAAGAGAATIGLAIPTAIFFLREHGPGKPVATPVITPAAGPGQLGLVLSGRF